jgi:hypothetical protein
MADNDPTASKEAITEQEMRLLKGTIVDLQHQLRDSQETVSTQATLISKLIFGPKPENETKA